MQTLPRRRAWTLARYENTLAPLLGCFAVGHAWAYAVPQNPWLQGWLVPLSLMLILLGLFLVTSRRWVALAAIGGLSVLWGGLYFVHFAFQPGPHDISRLAPRFSAEVTGTVVGVESAKRRLVLEAIQVNLPTKAQSRPVTGRLQATVADDVLPGIGAKITLKGDLREPFDTPIPGAFRQKQYLAQEGVTAVMKRATVTRILQPQATRWQDALLALAHHLTRRIDAVLQRHLDSPDAQVLGGIVLGNHAIPLDGQTKRQFIDTGLIHLLAASGMNVGIVAGFILGLAALCRVPERFRVIIAIAGVGFYALLTGLPPSIQRAAGMLECALFLRLLNRELQPLTLLALVTAGMLLLNPDAIGSISFQFSVLTTLGLLFTFPPLQAWLGHYITYGVSAALLVSLVAQVWILPLSLYYFNAFPLHSLVMNVVAVLLVTPLTVIGFTAAICALVWEPLGAGLTLLAWPFLKGMLLWVAWGAGLGWAQWRFASPPLWSIPLCYAGLVGFTLLINGSVKLPALSWRRWATAGMALGCLILLPACYQRYRSQGETRVDVLPLSPETTAFLLTPQGGGVPCLLAPGRLKFYEARTLGDYLRHRNIQRLAGLWVGSPPTTPLKGVTLLQEKTISPEGGGQRLHWGNWALQPQGTGLAVLADGQCLLQVGGRPVPHCAFHDNGAGSVSPQDSRLTLPDHGFQQWVVVGNRLTVF